MQACMRCPVHGSGSGGGSMRLADRHLVGLTTGPIQSSSAGFVGAFELATIAECAGTTVLDRADVTVEDGPGAIGGWGAKAVGFEASQVPSGMCDAAAALPRPAE